MSRRCHRLSLFKRCDFRKKGIWMKSNPTRAGPFLSGKLRSNSSMPMRFSAENRRGEEVCSQRRLAMSGDEGAR